MEKDYKKQTEIALCKPISCHIVEKLVENCIFMEFVQLFLRLKSNKSVTFFNLLLQLRKLLAIMTQDYPQNELERSEILR